MAVGAHREKGLLLIFEPKRFVEKSVEAGTERIVGCELNFWIKRCHCEPRPYRGVAISFYAKLYGLISCLLRSPRRCAPREDSMFTQILIHIPYCSMTIQNEIC